MPDTFFVAKRTVVTQDRAMGRPLRMAVGDVVYHVLNRANGGHPIFESSKDYAAFERIVSQAHERVPMRTLAYCLMPNHWHFVLWPRRDGDLSLFVGWITSTHAHRWRAMRGTLGTGHLYQGRFKSFPVQTDEHFLTVCRYVERNALRAGLVARAEDWSWCSLWRRSQASEGHGGWLADWPMARPKGWRDRVNAPQTSAELAALRRCVKRGQPYGEPAWTERTAERLGLRATLRSRGRPRKQKGA